MHMRKHFLFAAAVVVLVAATTGAALAASSKTSGTLVGAHHRQTATEQQVALTPSSAQLASCMPGARLTVNVTFSTERQGFDTFEITARHLPPERDFTIFLLQQAGSPFGAAEYIGDISTDADGAGQTKLKLIVQEAFSSTLVNGSRQRADLNRIGVWFADPLADDFCLGVGSPVTPFDGDNAAGVQAFNSANAEPLPAP